MPKLLLLSLLLQRGALTSLSSILSWCRITLASNRFSSRRRRLTVFFAYVNFWRILILTR